MILSKRNYVLLGVSLVLSAALAFAAVTRLNRPDPVTIPEETAIHVTLNEALSTNQNRAGDHFQATVSEPVSIQNKTVIPQGAKVEGLVLGARQSGRLMGRAQLELVLKTVEVKGKSYEIQTVSASRVSGNHKKRNIALIGGGAGGGSLIGAIAAGGKGAQIGGPVGAGAGTAVAIITGKKEVRLPAETLLLFYRKEGGQASSRDLTNI
jgi:hypothetical protein